MVLKGRDAEHGIGTGYQQDEHIPLYYLSGSNAFFDGLQQLMSEAPSLQPSRPETCPCWHICPVLSPSYRGLFPAHGD